MGQQIFDELIMPQVADLGHSIRQHIFNFLLSFLPWVGEMWNLIQMWKWLDQIRETPKEKGIILAALPEQQNAMIFSSPLFNITGLTPR